VKCTHTRAGAREGQQIRELLPVIMRCNALQCVAMRCSVLQCVAVCCSEGKSSSLRESTLHLVHAVKEGRDHA